MSFGLLLFNFVYKHYATISCQPSMKLSIKSRTASFASSVSGILVFTSICAVFSAFLAYIDTLWDKSIHLWKTFLYIRRFPLGILLPFRKSSSWVRWSSSFLAALDNCPIKSAAPTDLPHINIELAGHTFNVFFAYLFLN